jgi:hypothetical protein
VNGAAATPKAFVTTVIVVVLFENTPLAPEPGAVNVTLTPDTGRLPASMTVTASAFANAVLTVVDCGVVPAFAVIVFAAANPILGAARIGAAFPARAAMRTRRNHLRATDALAVVRSSTETFRMIRILAPRTALQSSIAGQRPHAEYRQDRHNRHGGDSKLKLSATLSNAREVVTRFALPLTQF